MPCLHFDEQRQALFAAQMRRRIDLAWLLPGLVFRDHAFDRAARQQGREFAVHRFGLHPTAPSSDTSSSFLASTANSIGSSRNTDLQKPSTIIETASSSPMPRLRQ